MQYKVPQKIDLEDKIIGPLTLKQFLYLLGGGTVIYIILSTYPSQWYIYVLIFLVAILSLAFAFVKVQDQDFATILFSIFSYLVRPRKRYWNKAAVVQKNVTIKNVDPNAGKEKEFEIKNPAQVKSRLQMLSEVVDTHGWGKEQYKADSLAHLEEAKIKGRVTSHKEVA